MASVFQQELTRDRQGRLERITLRYIDNARNRRKSELVKLKTLDSVLRYILTREFSRVFYPNGRANRRDILYRIRGYLGAASTVSNRYSRMQTMRASELTYESIQNYLVETIQQSNEEANMTNLEWTFFINPVTYQQGGAGNVSTKYKTNLYKDCYTEYSDAQGPVSCAAFALNYAMNYTIDKYKKKPINYITHKARLLQTELGWDQYVSMFEFQHFVDLYPQYRVSILLNKENVFRDHTFEGKDYVGDGTHTPFTIYIVFDQQHYFPVYSPARYFISERNSNAYVFCHTCVELFQGKNTNHDCGNWMLDEQPLAKPQIRTCEHCSQKYTRVCNCSTITCRNCKAAFEQNLTHRCILLENENKKEFYTGGALDGKQIALWVYDIESRIHITKETLTMQQIGEFETDDEDHFTGDIDIYDFDAREHKANLVVLKNVFTGEMKQWGGDDCLKHFIDFILAYNRGNNICYAHNASGYDTRLIFDAATKMETPTQKPIMRGCKFIKFSIGKTHFHDTLLHLQGSLRGLAKEYCSHIHLEKGYFPHLFNSVENYGYVGAIPSVDYFDLSFTIKDDDEFEKFMEWHRTWDGRVDWSFNVELEKYCINDVEVLCEIMKAHHLILVDKFGMSPWFKTTAPGFVHDVYLKKIFNTLEIPDRKEDPQGYFERIDYLAHNEFWAVLQPEEYDFARKALRGGRTEIRKVYHRVSDEDWGKGIRIRYQDICSQYPYQQAVHDFPVGTPTIYIWDSDMVPEVGKPNRNVVLDIVTTAPVPTLEELLRPEWFGIVCCTVEPPNDLYHPVLVHYDETLGKSIASCKRIDKGVFTSIEFQKALEMGYRIVTLHRFDRYNKRPSLWADVIKDLFIEKMVNSGSLPSPQDQQRLKREYDEAFGMGDDLQKTFDEQRWTKNPAKKKTFKIMLNSGWGKHAQRLNLTTQRIIHRINDHAEKLVLFENFGKNVLQLKNIIPLSATQDLYNIDNGTMETNYHSTYLPAGLFVPAYGRLHLWEQLNKLGKRVLMNDTDSIVYIYDPTQYNIPEGDVWGQWEVEDIDRKNGGIREFVGIGPKTYSIKCFNGETQTKCKGLSLKRGTDPLVNHETMKDLVVQDGVIQIQDKKIRVPQQTFVYKVGQGIRTHKMLKILSFNPNDLKGELDDEGYLYPFGYQ
jgi:hypothetical protein